METGIFVLITTISIPVFIRVVVEALDRRDKRAGLNARKLPKKVVKQMRSRI